MTVNELIKKLQDVSSWGLGDKEVNIFVDYRYCPLIEEVNADVGDDVYIYCKSNPKDFAPDEPIAYYVDLERYRDKVEEIREGINDSNKTN